jgi:hypothetical protein
MIQTSVKKKQHRLLLLAAKNFESLYAYWLRPLTPESKSESRLWFLLQVWANSVPVEWRDWTLENFGRHFSTHWNEFSRKVASPVFFERSKRSTWLIEQYFFWKFVAFLQHWVPHPHI